MIIEYDKNPAASPEQKIKTLAESVQRALNSGGRENVPEYLMQEYRRLQKLKGIPGEQGARGEDAAVLRIDSSRGTVFKNNAVATVLSAVIYYGPQRITNIDELHTAFGQGAHLEWKWQKINDDTFGTILSTDSRIGNGGFTLTLSPDDVDTKVTFICELII